jgi:small subunit ribosomal protein S2
MFNRISITVNQLIASDLFLGYHIANWNPRTNFFLIGKYRNTNIFNINYTYFLTKKFITFLSELFVNKGHLWLVNENFSLFNRSIELHRLSNLFSEITFLNSKWCKGMLSNYKYVSIVKPNKFPHSIFVPNMQNNHYVVNEAFIINVPSIAIVDSIDNPSNIFFPIPGNSKSLKSLFFFYIIIAKSLFYSRYIVSSKFIFNSIAFGLKGFNAKAYRNLFIHDYFSFFKKRFLLENTIFLFKSGFFSKRKFKFLFKPKLNVLYKTVLFRWKIPLLIISNIFKNVLYFGIFNKVKLKKRLIVKKLQFFKTLVSFLV